MDCSDCKHSADHFSPSPTHLDVRVLAEMLMNVDFDYAAMAFPKRVLPVPGGPKNITP